MNDSPSTSGKAPKFQSSTRVKKSRPPVEEEDVEMLTVTPPSPVAATVQLELILTRMSVPGEPAQTAGVFANSVGVHSTEQENTPNLGGRESTSYDQPMDEGSHEFNSQAPISPIMRRSSSIHRQAVLRKKSSASIRRELKLTMTDPVRLENNWVQIDQAIEEVSQLMESNTDPVLEVKEFLAQHGLGQVANCFVEHGFDNIHYLNDIITLGDLAEMGIKEDAEVRTLVNAVKLLPLPPKLPLVDIQAMFTEDMLKVARMELYMQLFHSSGYYFACDLVWVQDIVLHLIIGIKPLGHRRRLIYYINSLHSLLTEKQSKLIQAVAPLFNCEPTTSSARNSQDVSPRCTTEAPSPAPVSFLVNYLGIDRTNAESMKLSVQDCFGKRKILFRNDQKLPTILFEVCSSGLMMKHSDSLLHILSQDYQDIRLVATDLEDPRLVGCVTATPFQSSIRYDCLVFKTGSLEETEEIMQTVSLARVLYSERQRLIDPASARPVAEEGDLPPGSTSNQATHSPGSSGEKTKPLGVHADQPNKLQPGSSGVKSYILSCIGEPYLS